jgi:hypothetical protein
MRDMSTPVLKSRNERKFTKEDSMPREFNFEGLKTAIQVE